MPKLKFSCKGTLMRLATGFCAAFLNASVFTAAAGVACVATEVASGPTGVSCAISGKVNRSKTTSAPKARPTLFDNFISDLFPFLLFASRNRLACLPIRRLFCDISVPLPPQTNVPWNVPAVTRVFLTLYRQQMPFFCHYHQIRHNAVERRPSQRVPRWPQHHSPQHN